MKIIYENATTLVQYAFEDDAEVNMASLVEGQLQVFVNNIGEHYPKGLYLTHANQNTHTLVEDVTNLPEDFYGGKYTYANGVFTQIPTWHDFPEIEEE